MLHMHVLCTTHMWIVVFKLSGVACHDLECLERVEYSLRFPFFQCAAPDENRNAREYIRHARKRAIRI